MSECVCMCVCVCVCEREREREIASPVLFLSQSSWKKEGIYGLSKVKQNLGEDQIKSIKVLWRFKQNLFLIGLHFILGFFRI
jgi:hypothetical protein